MRLRSNQGLVFLVALFLFASTLGAQSGSQQPAGSTIGQGQQAPAQQPQDPNQPQQDPATQEPSGVEQTEQEVQQYPDAPNQPGDTVQMPAGQEPETGDGGVFVFKKKVEEVVLHATVVDARLKPVTSLSKESFQVYEDGVPQKITNFRREDIPVALGILIDNSGTMRDKRAKVNQAALNLVKASNPQDEVFIVNFGDEYFLDQDFTGDINLMQEALEKVESRGGTALFDAVIASIRHMMDSAKLEKKVLLIVSDGIDNVSQATLEQAVKFAQVEDGPTIYTLGLLDDEGSDKKRGRRVLGALSNNTGGVAFFPDKLDEVNAISLAIARDIRNQYTIMYKPTKPQDQGGYRQVRVEAKAPGQKKLTVRTKSGYYAGQQQGQTRASK